MLIFVMIVFSILVDLAKTGKKIHSRNIIDFEMKGAIHSNLHRRLI